MTDVIVIGAGVVGCATARELARYALRVVVLEKGSDVAEGATKSNSAIVHAGFDAKPGTLKARFNAAGNAQFEPLCREMGVPFQRNTSLVVAFSPEELPRLEELKARGEENGVPGLRLVGRDELAALEPHIGREARAALRTASNSPSTAAFDRWRATGAAGAWKPRTGARSRPAPS